MMYNHLFASFHIIHFWHWNYVLPILGFLLRIIIIIIVLVGWWTCMRVFADLSTWEILSLFLYLLAHDCWYQGNCWKGVTTKSRCAWESNPRSCHTAILMVIWPLRLDFVVVILPRSLFLSLFLWLFTYYFLQFTCYSCLQLIATIVIFIGKS